MTQLFIYLISLICLVHLIFANTKAKLPRVKYVILKKSEKCEQKAKVGNVLVIQYKGMLSNGTVFDSSWDRKKPYQLQLGIGEVMKGLEIGLKGMCTKEKRRIIIPPHLAFGKTGQGKTVPPNETLIYEVDLYGITAGKKLPENVFKRIDANKDRKLTRTEVRYFVEEYKNLPEQYKTVDAYLDYIFGAEDTNKDGVISFTEFNGPKHDEL